MSLKILPLVPFLLLVGCAEPGPTASSQSSASRSSTLSTAGQDLGDVGLRPIVYEDAVFAVDGDRSLIVKLEGRKLTDRTQNIVGLRDGSLTVTRMDKGNGLFTSPSARQYLIDVYFKNLKADHGIDASADRIQERRMPYGTLYYVEAGNAAEQCILWSSVFWSGAMLDGFAGDSNIRGGRCVKGASLGQAALTTQTLDLLGHIRMKW